MTAILKRACVWAAEKAGWMTFVDGSLVDRFLLEQGRATLEPKREIQQPQDMAPESVRFPLDRLATECGDWLFFTVGFPTSVLATVALVAWLAGLQPPEQGFPFSNGGILLYCALLASYTLRDLLKLIARGIKVPGPLLILGLGTTLLIFIGASLVYAGIVLPEVMGVIEAPRVLFLSVNLVFLTLIYSLCVTLWTGLQNWRLDTELVYRGAAHLRGDVRNWASDRITDDELRTTLKEELDRSTKSLPLPKTPPIPIQVLLSRAA